jgi:copper(I)-binding protein
MLFTRRPVPALLSVAAIALLSSCGQGDVLRVNEAVVKLSPVDQNPSVMYFTIHGGPADVSLVAVTSPSAQRTELHESKVDAKTGMMTMERITRLKVPAGSKIEFKRGGKHLMLYGINLPARRLQRMEVLFVFSNGDRILVEPPIEKITATNEEHGSH